ncbi:MAG: MafI family immunity protein, partial [Bacteroidota bacterium]
KALGLRNEAAINAKEFIKNSEYKLSFEVIVEQLYEYDIEITYEFYVFAIKVANRLNIQESAFTFLKELIRDESQIPKPVIDGLMKIIASISK